MTKLPNFKGKSQFEEDIHEHFRTSACGPVTAYVIRNYLLDHPNDYTVNELYRKLKSTKIGLFKWRFIRHLRQILGSQWTVERCDIHEVIQQIDAGRPVAAKFDKWFRFRWLGQFSYIYHWVPVIGYDYKGDNLMLIIHDNGSRNRPSMIHHIPYEPNKSILSFVKIEPNNQ